MPAQPSVTTSVTLSGELRAPSDARSWARARVAQLPPECIEDALLVVSELVTNAVRHGRPDVVLSLAVGTRHVRVEVLDGGEALPVVPAGQPSADRSTGRGLLIVASTASDWGITRTQGCPGKTVWAELDLPPAAAGPA